MVKSGVRQEQEPLIDEGGQQPHQMRYRWVMLALVWILYSTFSVVWHSIAPLVTPILEDLNISYSQMGLILGSWPLTYIVVAAIGGVYVNAFSLAS